MKKLSIFLGIIFISVSIICVKKDNIKKVNFNDRLDSIVSELLERDPINDGYIDIEWLTDVERQEVENSKDKEKLSKLYFIEGFNENINLNREAALNYFEKALSNLPDKTDKKLKSRIYYEQSNILYSEDEEESKALFRKVKDIYEDENDKEYLLKLSILKGKKFMDGDIPASECIEVLEEALTLAKEIEYDDIIDIYYYLGTAYWYDNQQIQAINYKLEALSAAYDTNRSDKVEFISIDLAIDFLEIGNYDDAIKYLKTVIDNMPESFPHDYDYFTPSYAWMNLVEAYTKAGRYEEAEETLEIARVYVEKQDNGKKRNDDITMLDIYKAEILTRLGYYEQAQAFLEKFKEGYNNTEIEFSYMDMDISMENLQGDIYYGIERYSDALECHLNAREMIDERKLLNLVENSNKKIYMDYVSLGNYETAFEYSRANNEIKSEASKNTDAQYSHYLISKFNNDKNELRIGQLEQSQKIARITSLFLGLIAFSSIVFTSIIYKKNKEIKRLNEIFKNLSATDGLTAIPNRRALDEYLLNNWANPSFITTRIPISFAMIDIDYFKKYNDNYGHPQGDEVLKKISECIKASFRKSDFIARYGGEEFTIIMLNTDKHESEKLISRLLNNIYNLNIKHEYSEVSDRVTLSIGISTTERECSKSYDEYIAMADNALYQAKKIRNTFVHIGNVE